MRGVPPEDVDQRERRRLVRRLGLQAVPGGHHARGPEQEGEPAQGEYREAGQGDQDQLLRQGRGRSVRAARHGTRLVLLVHAREGRHDCRGALEQDEARDPTGHDCRLHQRRDGAVGGVAGHRLRAAQTGARAAGAAGGEERGGEAGGADEDEHRHAQPGPHAEAPGGGDGGSGAAEAAPDRTRRHPPRVRPPPDQAQGGDFAAEGGGGRGKGGDRSAGA
mmetsp:Transcript_24654/g.58571  ORF Transcript_24654/g.58571 Transcript_24654/m.58571 type:complete len:220 (+) Transcript_24654:83-742(+)